MRVVALLLALLLAGCLSATDGPAVPVEPGPSSTSLALAGDGSMGRPPSAEEIVPLKWGWRQWLEGETAPAWTSEPFPQATLVTSATATVLYEALSPVSTLGTRPEWTVWFGVGESVVDHGFQPGPPVLVTGQRGTAVFELNLPAGGLFVGPGESLVLRIGSYYDDDAARGAIAAVFGAEETTRVDVETLPLPAPTTPRESVTHEETAELTGGRCVGLDRATEADMVWFDIVADPTRGRLVGIDIDVAHLSGHGPPDVDLLLLDAEGELVGHAAGSAGTERLRLREPNLAGAAPDARWMLGVYACTPQRSTSSVTVVLHYA